MAGSSREHPERGFGPIVGTQYTVSGGVLKLTAQFLPLDDTPHRAVLQARLAEEDWRQVAEAALLEDSWTAAFRVADWDATRAQDFRVLVELADGSAHHYDGLIRAEPLGEELVVASLNCVKHYTGGLAWNSSALWFPHAETAAAVAAQDPDLLYFAGDQLYEGDIDPVDARDVDTLLLDYLYKWSRWCWSFGELTRTRPTVTVPDDHDVYHGNLWGAGGRRARADRERGLSAQDAGGYKHPPRFVNAVHATQTSHLPDPVDPEPVGEGYSVYFTQLDYGGLSFAILSDRQFKDSASVLVPDGEVRNGWFRAEGFDPLDADVPGAPLLGARQERFLDDWSLDFGPGVWAKVVLSQTPFVNVATIPGEAGGGEVLPSLPVPEPGVVPEGYKFAADTDSGGWPQSARDRAVRMMRRCLAVHLAGDQHLGTLVQYGVDDFRDAGFVFTSPAVANTWPRRWWPPLHGGNPEPGAPHYTGDFRDGFGNLMTVWGAANPVVTGREPAALYDRAPGYGIARFRREAREVVFESWPRWTMPADGDEAQHPGWPRTISLADGGLSASGLVLPELLDQVPAAEQEEFEARLDRHPIVEIWRTLGEVDELESVLRLPSADYRLPVRDQAAEYRVVLRGAGGHDREIPGLRPIPQE